MGTVNESQVLGYTHELTFYIASVLLSIHELP